MDEFFALNQLKFALRPGFALRFISDGCLAQLWVSGFGRVCGLLFLPRGSCDAQQRTLGADQIGQGEEDVHLRRVFPHPPVAHFAVSEEVLDDVERMLHQRPGSAL